MGAQLDRTRFTRDVWFEADACQGPTGSRSGRRTFAPAHRVRVRLCAGAGGLRGRAVGVALGTVAAFLLTPWAASAQPRKYYAQILRQPATPVTSASTSVSVHRPRIGPEDVFSVASMAVARYSPTTHLLVEAGWVVSEADSVQTHFFTLWRGPRVPACVKKRTFQGVVSVADCDFRLLSTASVDPIESNAFPDGSSSAIEAGDAVRTVERSLHWEYRTEAPVEPSSRQDARMLAHYGEKGWWLRTNGEWLGYYGDANFTPYAEGSQTTTSEFTAGNVVFFNGEVLADADRPCTEMGNGHLGIAPTAAYFREMKVNGAPSPLLNFGNASHMTDPERYSVGPHPTASDGFHFGGSGDNCIG